MSRAPERSAPALFATLLASGPQRFLQIRVFDVAAATSAHVVLFGILVWLTTHNARPVLAFESDVNTLMLADNTALSWRATTSHVAASVARHAPAGGRGMARAAVALPEAPVLPDLNEVVAAVERSVKAMVSAGVADELIRAAAAQLNISLARDTMPYIPTLEELSKGPVLTAYTSGPELLNRKDIARLLQEQYPPELVALDRQGLTTLWLLIDQAGTVRQARIARSSGVKRFDRIALDVVPRMKFQRALNRGIPTPVWVQLPVRFQIVYEQ